MSNTGFRAIDTASFDAVMDIRAELLSDYDKINADYERITNTLLDNWKGRGADAFRADAARVRTNIGGIYDILKIMSDTLIDCREIIGMTDNQLGEVNRDPFSE